MAMLTCGTVQLTRSRTRFFFFLFLLSSLRCLFFLSISLTLAQQIWLRRIGVSCFLVGMERIETYPSLYAKS